MISYAQNYEDVMLWRALGYIENGFYVDVGAAWPDEHSVTKLFYDSGWRGINIEPNPEFYKKYLADREEDINLNIAISDKKGETELYFIDDTGLSSLDKGIADSHKKIGFFSKPSIVTVSTLTSVLAEYVKEKEIHFLKVDVEGLEKQVLLGNDWSRFRPWVLLIESTKPMSQEENYQEWESIVIQAGYVFAYADGLNRFYVADEHKSLLDRFRYPPNVFDEFVLASQVDSEARVHELEKNFAELEAKVNELEVLANEACVRKNQAEACASDAKARLEVVEAKAKEIEADYIKFRDLYLSVINSNSWRSTKPLRLLGKLGRWLFYGSIAWVTFSKTSRPRRLLKAKLIILKHYINKHPKLKRFVMRMLKLTPVLKEKLRGMGRPLFDPVQGDDSANKIIGYNNLNLRAKEIFDQLKELEER